RRGVWWRDSRGASFRSRIDDPTRLLQRRVGAVRELQARGGFESRAGRDDGGGWGTALPPYRRRPRHGARRDAPRAPGGLGGVGADDDQRDRAALADRAAPSTPCT